MKYKLKKDEVLTYIDTSLITKKKSSIEMVCVACSKPFMARTKGKKYCDLCAKAIATRKLSPQSEKSIKMVCVDCNQPFDARNNQSKYCPMCKCKRNYLSYEKLGRLNKGQAVLLKDEELTANDCAGLKNIPIDISNSSGSRNLEDFFVKEERLRKEKRKKLKAAKLRRKKAEVEKAWQKNKLNTFEGF